jgi:hypothetical protein
MSGRPGKNKVRVLEHAVGWIYSSWMVVFVQLTTSSCHDITIKNVSAGAAHREQCAGGNII